MPLKLTKHTFNCLSLQSMEYLHEMFYLIITSACYDICIKTTVGQGLTSVEKLCSMQNIYV